jgi:alginate O-acetyltransferase complex protein AlgI
MVFSSIIFLFFFLPIVLLVYALAGKNYRNLTLLLVSLLFYAWGEGVYLLVMLASILFNYLCGILMFRRGEKPSVAVLVVGVVANLSLLGFFKYANFFVDNINVVLLWGGLAPLTLNPVHLPIGISFFTFQAISYVIDSYRKEVAPQKNFVNLGLYIALFPQLIAGPIVRYHDIVKEIYSRKVNVQIFASGARRFLFGLSKKVLLANPLAAVADTIFTLPAGEVSTPVAWLGALCYTLQIYFDFSGYSDMAIGLGKMFGFHFLENFNYPYISRSIREFWRRWHISLSSWLRDYLYIPLGGNRKGELRTYCNLLIVFTLCGFWHGASWTFVCWGLYHGLFLAVERTRLGGWLDNLWLPVQHFWTLLVVIVGWIFFRCETLGQAFVYLSTMFGFSGAEYKNQALLVLFPLKAQVEVIVACLIALPVYPMMKEFFHRARQKGGVKTVFFLDISVHCGRLVVQLILCYFALISLAAGAYNPFIYFRF